MVSERSLRLIKGSNAPTVYALIPIRNPNVGMGRRLVRLRSDEASLVSLCPVFEWSRTRSPPAREQPDTPVAHAPVIHTPVA
jgi:hypothetical protein